MSIDTSSVIANNNVQPQTQSMVMRVPYNHCTLTTVNPIKTKSFIIQARSTGAEVSRTVLLNSDSGLSTPSDNIQVSNGFPKQNLSNTSPSPCIGKRPGIIDRSTAWTTDLTTDDLRNVVTNKRRISASQSLLSEKQKEVC